MTTGTPPPTTDPGRSATWPIVVMMVVLVVLASVLAFLLLRSMPNDGSDGLVGVGAARQGDVIASDTENLGPDSPSFALASRESLRCPVMTDSIDRIHLALFENKAGDVEFADAVNRYRAGEVTLSGIAQELATSERFNLRHTDPDDEAFIRLVYRNALRMGEPPAEDLEFWLAAIGSGGQSRGSMVVTLTESERAVDVSRTEVPMSGFLRTYPAGTHWYCGVGPVNDLPVRTLTGSTLYADQMFHNGGSVAELTYLRTVTDDASVRMTDMTLPAGATSYRWDGHFHSEAGFGSALDIRTGPQTWWAVVFYPEPIGAGRLGWQLEP